MSRKKQELLKVEQIRDCHVLQYPGRGNVNDNVKKEIKRMINKHFNQGILQSMTLVEYSKEHFPGFPVSTINGCVLDCISGINEVQSTEARFKFDKMYTDILDKMSNISSGEDHYFEKPTEEIFALKTTADTIDKYMTFMERWNIKPKPNEVVEVKNGNMSVDDMRKIYEERKQK